MPVLILGLILFANYAFPPRTQTQKSTPVLMSRITEFHLKISLGMLEYYHGKQK